jgi:hypothetical protein
MDRIPAKAFSSGNSSSLSLSQVAFSLIFRYNSLCCPRSLMDRASDCGSEGCEFESRRGRKSIFIIEYLKMYERVVLAGRKVTILDTPVDLPIEKDDVFEPWFHRLNGLGQVEKTYSKGHLIWGEEVPEVAKLIFSDHMIPAEVFSILKIRRKHRKTPDPMQAANPQELSDEVQRTKLL